MECATEQFNELMGNKNYLFVVENDFFEMFIEEQSFEELLDKAETDKNRMWIKRNIVKLLWFMINETYVYDDALELETNIRKERLRLELKRIGEEDVKRFVPSHLSKIKELELKSRSQKVLCVFEKRNDEVLYEKIVYQAEEYPISGLPKKVVKLLSPRTYTLLVAVEKLLEGMKEKD